MKVLETIGLTESFGGLIALENVNFSVENGELRGVIGPNGAGKTTFFNVITGYIKPTKGKILLHGKEIGGLPPHAIAQKGVSRAFQISNLFPEMTVYESVWAGVNARSQRPWRPFVNAGCLDDISEKSTEICRLLGLGGKMHEVSANLSHGDQRVLEIGIALSTDPMLLLLDEPTQGVSPKDIDGLMEVIEKVSRITTTILIEHDMHVLLNLSHNITVLHEGRIIAEGTPDEISRSEKVQKIYLGIG